MNKIFFLLFVALVSSQLKAQVNIIDVQEKPLETTVYDSLLNMSKYAYKYKGESSYKYLIGQTLIYVGKGSPGLIKVETNGNTEPTISVGTQFEVIDVLSNAKHKHYQEPFLLKEKESGNVYEYNGGWHDNYRWVVLGYYEKIKKDYVGKNYVYIKSTILRNKKDEIIDFNTEEQITKVPENSLWKCTDISLKIRDPQDYNWISDSRSPIILIFENEQFGKCYCYVEDQFGQRLKDEYSYGYDGYGGEEKRDLFLAKFQEENEYKIYQARHKELLVQRKQEMAKRKAALTKKYGASNAALIVQGRVRIGMTKKMCIESWGEPKSVNTTTGSYGTHEQWVYSSGDYLYFENGILTTIQD